MLFISSLVIKIHLLHIVYLPTGDQNSLVIYCLSTHWWTLELPVPLGLRKNPTVKADVCESFWDPAISRFRSFALLYGSFIFNVFDESLNIFYSSKTVSLHFQQKVLKYKEYICTFICIYIQKHNAFVETGWLFDTDSIESYLVYLTDIISCCLSLPHHCWWTH